jgi:hypothetical protein
MSTDTMQNLAIILVAVAVIVTNATLWRRR